MRTIFAETAIILLVFGAAAAWRFTPPPRALAAAAATPAFVHIHADRAMADVTLTPGRTGPVAVSVLLMNPEFGPLEAKELSVVFVNATAGIEPIRRKAAATGDGSWHVDGLVLPVAGSWDVRLDILINDFEIARLDGKLAVLPGSAR